MPTPTVLARVPVAVLSLGPLASGEVQGAQEQHDAQVAKHTWLKPVSSALFGGAFDPARLGFLDGLLTKLPASPLYQRPAGDARDWAVINAWAEDLSGKLASTSG